MPLKIKVIIDKNKSGGYVAFCPELKGCMSQGETMEEVMANIKEAASGWLETKVKLELDNLIRKNREAKIPKNGHKKEIITIRSSKFQLAGA